MSLYFHCAAQWRCETKKTHFHCAAYVAQCSCQIKNTTFHRAAWRDVGCNFSLCDLARCEVQPHKVLLSLCGLGFAGDFVSSIFSSYFCSRTMSYTVVKLLFDLASCTASDINDDRMASCTADTA